MISVVMATHNRAGLVGDAIESILAQTYPNLEMIVVDDSSEDETPEILKRLAVKDSRMTFVRLATNVGPGEARNVGIRQSRGDLIAIMDDDDLAMPHRLQTQLTVMSQNPQVGLTFSCVELFRTDGTVLGIEPRLLLCGGFPEEPDNVFRLLYLERNLIQNTTAMFRADVLKHFEYPASPWIGEDKILCLKMCAKRIRMKGIREPLVRMRFDPGRSLMSGLGNRVIQDRRAAMEALQLWLKEERITKFDGLHRIAEARQLLREARAIGGSNGFRLTLRAARLTPTSWNAYSQLCRLCLGGLRRLLGHPWRHA